MFTCFYADYYAHIRPFEPIRRMYFYALGPNKSERGCCCSPMEHYLMLVGIRRLQNQTAEGRRRFANFPDAWEHYERDTGLKRLTLTEMHDLEFKLVTTYFDR